VSARLAAEVTVVAAALVAPVITSVATKIPTGTVMVNDVAVGLVITEATAALVPPLIDSPTEKLAEAATTSVIVPIGYVEIAEDEDSRAKLRVFSSTVHKLRPLFAHSANKRFKDLRAVAASYPVRNSSPHLSNASSMASDMFKLKSAEPEVAMLISIP
tara:strand:- start:251 stop:727 length:477 start_codon:yes stop_codon:yes gene_type:complete